MRIAIVDDNLLFAKPCGKYGVKVLKTVKTIPYLPHFPYKFSPLHHSRTKYYCFEPANIY